MKTKCPKKSMDDIAEQIIADLDLKERVRPANLPESEIEAVDKVLERYLAEIAGCQSIQRR